MAAPVKQLSDGNPGGSGLGQSTSDLISFHAVTPISQRASATLSSTLSLFTMSGASFVANTTSTISGVWAFNSTYAAQLIDAIIEIRAQQVAYGLHKGGA